MLIHFLSHNAHSVLFPAKVTMTYLHKLGKWLKKVFVYVMKYYLAIKKYD